MGGMQRLMALTVMLALSLALSGCGMLGWFGGEKDPRPPTKLDDRFVPQWTARTLWTTRVGVGTAGRALNLVPAVLGDTVYVADARGLVVALDLADGRLLWQRDTRLLLSAGPEARGEWLALGSSKGEILLLARADGQERWRAALGTETLAIPRLALSQEEGGHAAYPPLLVTHTIDDQVRGLALSDGKELWRYVHPVPLLTLHGSATPVVVGNQALFGLTEGRLVNLALRDGVPNWELTITPPRGRTELDRIADIVADPLVVGEVVYTVAYNGDLAAVDIATGAILWRRALSAHAGLAADDQSLYIVDAEDRVWAADPADGAARWHQDQLRYRRLSAPVVVGQYVVVGDFEGWLHWLDRADGRLVARARIARARIAQRPVTVAGNILVYAYDGTLALVGASGAQ